MTTMRRTVAAGVLVGLIVVAGVLALGAYRRSAATPERRPVAVTTVRPVRRTVPVATTTTVPRPVLSKQNATLDDAGGTVAGKLAPNDAAALASVLAPGDLALGCVPDPHPPALPTPKAIDPLVCYATGRSGSVTVVIATVPRPVAGHATVAVVVPPNTPALPGGASVELPS